MLLDTETNFGHVYIPNQPIRCNLQGIRLGTLYEITTISWVQDSGEIVSELICRSHYRDLPSFQVVMYVDRRCRASYGSVGLTTTAAKPGLQQSASTYC